ncbi:MAG: alpha/beta hydrolase [Brevundimonas sp.]|nr:MAG: alpha/beta hydrolase [Brevundimonas sp.]
MPHTHTSTSAPLLAHQLLGSGPGRVLVLHDWNGDHASYHPMWPCLDGERFTYAFVDLRGYGASRDLAGQYTVEEVAADAFAVADHLGWARFHLIGHSMTGVAVQRMAVDAPTRIASVVALCPMSAAGSPAPAEARDFFVSTTTDDDAFRRLLTFVTGGLSKAWIEKKLLHSRTTASPACRRGYLDMFWHADFVDEVRGLKTPFLVVVGDKDPGLDAALMERTFLDWHPNAQLRVIPNCGHYPMEECPPFLAGLIEAFLERQA